MHVGIQWNQSYSMDYSGTIVECYATLSVVPS